MEQNDEALMGAFQEGDEAAMEELIRRHGGSLLGYLTHMTGNPTEAKDLFQETFLRVQTRSATFRRDGRFKSWLFAIASHAAFDFFRHRRRQPDLVPLQEAVGNSDSLEAADPRPAPDAQAAQADLARVVRQALDRLPPGQRATLVLAYYEGLSYPEVAAALKCSVSTVKTQMSRALGALARILPPALAAGTAGGAA